MWCTNVEYPVACLMPAGTYGVHAAACSMPCWRAILPQQLSAAFVLSKRTVVNYVRQDVRLSNNGLHAVPSAPALCVHSSFWCVLLRPAYPGKAQAC